ncbi:hypothetical protein Tdes44962_MAKER03494 [Teratosphaeria destructans]|uniref:Uncharacterized protein n=1 Tax=Teratosphaeria destructans TaxID=418781 RepID=A0A9W7SPV1_9PEZI|nr:hypothetical protein Tdes44962_MAKER03494 [Teratosphaeria destructans]
MQPESTKNQLLDIVLSQAREPSARQQQNTNQSRFKDRWKDSRLALHEADVALRDIIATRMEAEKEQRKTSWFTQGGVVVKTCFKRVHQNHAEDISSVIKVSQKVVAVVSASKKGKSK